VDRERNGDARASICLSCSWDSRCWADHFRLRDQCRSRNISGSKPYKRTLAKQHVNVTVKYLASGAAVLAAMQGGSLQVGDSNIVSVMQAYSSGIKTACFAGHVGDAHFPLVVGANSGITTLAGLKGKKIATGPSPITAAMVKQLLTDKGVNASSVDYDLSTAYNVESTVLSSGADAAAAPPPPFSIIAESAGAKVLVPDVQRTVVGDAPLTCWAAKPSWIKANKPAAEAFLSALAEAHSWMATHPTQYRKIAQTSLKMSASLAKALPISGVDTNALSTSEINTWAKLAKRWQVISSLVPTGDIFTPVVGA
jgi:ABC-type nitrate/sulfonate/bicarbonate transport system substrate-binding protein